MESIISIIAFLLVFFGLASRNIKRQQAQAEKRRAQQAQALGKQPYPVQKKANVSNHRESTPDEFYGKKVSSGVKKSSLGGTSIKDDRGNDWLARQMREEKRSFALMREMFGLKAHNGNVCDAELLREFHRHTCEAEGIDTAAGR